MSEQNNPSPQVGGKLKSFRPEADVNKLVYGRIQPQAVPLEEAVLGAIMLDKDGLPSVIHVLKPETFYLPAHQEIYKVMFDLFQKSQPIDLLTVHEALRKAEKIEMVGGPSYLMELTNKVASSANVEYHAKIVAQKYIQRQLIKVSTDIIHDSFEDTKDVLDLLDEAERHLYEISDSNLSSEYKDIGNILIDVKNEIELSSQQGDALTGVTTGFSELDKMTNGWQKSDLMILAARPGMGKTAFALSLAKNAAEHGKSIALFSLEMSKNQLVTRLISMEAELNSKQLRNGDLNELEWEKLNDAVEKLSNLNIFIDDTPALNIYELRAKSRRLKQQHDLDMIVIDYLQLMQAAPGKNRGNREQEISSISRALKALAKELNIPVISLSQLSRAVESRAVKRPMLSDLRESGAIEQDADIVTFIYRPDYYDNEDFDAPKGLTEIILAKHRNGGLGTVELKFVGEFVKFMEPEAAGFNDISGNDIFGDATAGGIITRPSRLNEDTDDTPF